MSDRAYRVLGVTPDATPEQVQQACYQLTKKWFPARSPLPPEQYQEAEQKFLEIVGAYGQIVQEQVAIAGAAPYPTCAQLFYERAQVPEADAMDDLNIALHLNPDYAEAYRLRGALNLKQGFESRSVADLKRAQALGLELVSPPLHPAAPPAPVTVTSATPSPLDSGPGQGAAPPEADTGAEVQATPEALRAPPAEPDGLIVQFKLGLLLIFVCILATVSLAALSWFTDTEGGQGSSPSPEVLEP